MWLVPAVRFLVFLIALSSPIQAELIARFHTTQGVVDAVLQYQKVPQAVANFITLAEGSRPWVDPKSGAVTLKPFYNGTKIHRIGNNAEFKFAQGGSRIGDGSDGPGYTFKDQFDPTLTHVPYVLSMGNRGPNSNGSGFFFTGDIPIPSYDNSYTLFGIVTDLASRLVIDAMISAGPNGTTINSITILRTDPAAMAFDVHAQNLPTVSKPTGSLSVTPGISAKWQLGQAMETGDIFRSFGSTTLTSGSWTESNTAYTHSGISPAVPAPPITSVDLDNALTPKAFYNLSLARHPGSVTPSTLANRTMSTTLGTEILNYAFDATGNGGIATYTSGSQTPIVFPFVLLDFISEGHAVIVIVQNQTSQISQFLQFRIGCDTTTNQLITGRNFSYAFNFSASPDPWIPIGGGPATITR